MSHYACFIVFLSVLVLAQIILAFHCDLRVFNIFHALDPGHLQVASAYTVGLRGATLKCLKFCHICRQDVNEGLGVGGGEEAFQRNTISGKRTNVK